MDHRQADGADRSAYSDANGDGVPNAGDIFGSIKTKNQGEETPHFLLGFDLNLFSRGENGSLIIDFDDVEGLQAYQVSPEHVAFGQFVGTIRIDRACIDYEF